MKQSINKVTTERLDVALRLIGVKIDLDTLDKIIDIVELIEKRGGKTNLTDIAELEADWDFDNILKEIRDSTTGTPKEVVEAFTQ